MIQQTIFIIKTKAWLEYYVILILYKANVRNTQQYFPYIFCFDIFQSATSSSRLFPKKQGNANIMFLWN